MYTLFSCLCVKLREVHLHYFELTVNGLQGPKQIVGTLNIRDG